MEKITLNSVFFPELRGATPETSRPGSAPTKKTLTLNIFLTRARCNLRELEKAELCQSGILRQMAFLSAALSKLESNQGEMRSSQQRKESRSSSRASSVTPGGGLMSPKRKAPSPKSSVTRSKSASSLPTGPSRKVPRSLSKSAVSSKVPFM